MQNYKIETESDGREITVHGTKDFPCASYDEYFSLFFNQEVPWHWHDEIEIVLVIEGATRVQCFNRETILHNGEMLFINANTMHRLTNHGEQDCRILNVVFDPQMLGGIQFGRIYKKHILPVIQNTALQMYKFDASEPWHLESIETLRQAFVVWQAERMDREFNMTIALMKFWHRFCVNYPDMTPTTQHSTVQEKRLQAAMNFIHQEYAETISVADISQASHISESECYRLFRATLQCSPNAYLTRYRLRMSAQALTQTDKAIAAIAYEAGFNCPAYFTKKFKQAFGKTPREFRHKPLVSLDI